MCNGLSFYAYIHSIRWSLIYNNDEDNNENDEDNDEDENDVKTALRVVTKDQGF